MLRPFTVMGMHVRPARPEDRERLLAVWERSVRATHDFLQERDIQGLRPLVAEGLAGESVQWWVLATTDDTPAGFLGFVNDTVEALFIDPDYHGQGGGKLLMSHAQTLAGGRALAVDVNEQNGDAIGFYEAMGFSIVGRSPTDSGGRPFPLLHMKRPAPGASAAPA